MRSTLPLLAMTSEPSDSCWDSIPDCPLEKVALTFALNEV